VSNENALAAPNKMSLLAACALVRVAREQKLAAVSAAKLASSCRLCTSKVIAWNFHCLTAAAELTPVSYFSFCDLAGIWVEPVSGRE
jgi:hypothetical protein